jgi:hypothetical protein
MMNEMKRIYRLASTMMIVTGVCTNLSAQTSIGDGSGKQGQDGTYVGTWAGSQTTGTDNTFIGSASGVGNSVGNRNTALGSRSAYTLKTGNDNTFVGAYSGKSNYDGSFNTFIGTHSGFGNNEGLRNSFVGAMAGYGNKKGSDNVFLGHKSGYANTIGLYNSFIGNQAGEANITGTQNVFLGFRAGYSNVGGNGNTFLGYLASGDPNVKYSTALGMGANVTRDNSVVLGTSYTNIGISTSAPLYKLHVGTSDAAKVGSSTWIVASDQRLKQNVSDYKDGLDALKQIKPVWFSYNGQAGMPTKKRFVGIIAQEMQKIAPYTVGNFTYIDSLGNKTDYLDYDANAITYMIINSVKEQQEIIEQKEAKIQEISGQVTELSKRLEQLERIIASGPLKPIGNPAAKLGSEPNENGVVLEQNAPNGFSQTTSINFFIPQTVKDAVVNIYSTDGKKVGSYPVSDRGQSVLKLSAKTFRSGVFIYDLVTDGKSNGAKKMVVTE